MEFNFKVRRIIEKDWAFLDKWEAPSKDLLPENGLGGFIVDKDGFPIAACWLWMTNSKTGFTMIKSDPLYKDTDKEEAIKELNQFVEMFSQDMGLKKLLDYGN